VGPFTALRERQQSAKSGHSQIPARNRRLAVAAIAECLLEEVAKYGVANVKRINGDRIGLQLGGWKKVLLDH
jgi:transketolase